jgi:ankyrin repeat protein
MIRCLVPLLVVLLTSCGASELDKMLIEAALYGDVDKMSILIDRGANVNGVAFEAWTPLTRAASAGQLEAVKLLVARGADVNRGTGDNSSQSLSPLFFAAAHGHINMVRFLVEKGGHLRLDPVLKASFLELVRSYKNDELIGLVGDLMARENS